MDSILVEPEGDNMSVWTTKAYGADKNYVVIKHTVPGVNHIINGVKFRAGYAVVSKPSKTYSGLKKLPVLKNAREFPITYLTNLPFITRQSDIRVVYGTDVYYTYRKALTVLNTVQAEVEKVEEVKQHIADKTKCQYKTLRSSGEELCSHDAVENTINSYCLFHILEDPIVKELDIEIPAFATKNEKKKLRNDVATKVKSLKKD